MPGQKHILDYLKKSVENDKLSHAYLFTGPSQSGKNELVLWLTESLKCQGPDIRRISEKIGIEEIRKLKKYLSLSAHSSPYKIAIIDQAEKMTSEAANALLKTLEEPRGNTVLILITNKPSSLLKTIVSRCEEIKFRQIPLDKIAKDFIKKEHTDIFKKSLNDKFKYIEKISKDNSQIISLLDSWLFWFRKQSPERFIKTLKEIQKTKNLILNTNVNKRLALENLVLDLK